MPRNPATSACLTNDAVRSSFQAVPYRKGGALPESLEEVACCELYLPLAVQPSPRDRAKVTVADGPVRLVVLSPIENVESFDAQLERAVSRHTERLEHR